MRSRRGSRRAADLRRRGRVRVPGRGAAQRVVKQRCVEHGASQPAEHRQAMPVLGVGQRRDAPARRLQPEQPAHRRRNADRGAAVRPEPDRRQACGDGGGRPAARATRGTPRVPWIARGPVRARLGHVTPHGQLRHRGLAQYRRSCEAQTAHDLGVAPDGRVVGAGAVTGDLAGEVDVVLHRHGYAQQRPRLPRAQPLQRGVGLRERRLGTNGHECPELGVQTLDPPHVQLDELARRDLAAPQQLGQARSPRERQVFTRCRRARGGSLR